MSDSFSVFWVPTHACLGGGVLAVLSAVGLMLDIMFLALPWTAPDLQADTSKSFVTAVIGSAIGVFGVMLTLMVWRIDQPDDDEDE